MPGPKTASPRATARIAASVATLYLDTSALVKFYVKEEGRETVFEAVEGPIGWRPPRSLTPRPGPPSLEK